MLLSAVVGWFVGRPLVRFASQPEQFRQCGAGFQGYGRATIHLVYHSE